MTEKKKRKKSIKTANPENYKDKNHNFNVGEAIKYNLEKSIILCNLRYWLDKNKANNKHIYQSEVDDNYYIWTYNSGIAFEELFPYMKSKSILKWLDELKKDGVILTGNFNKVKYDRTNWYTIKDEYFIKKGEKSISTTESSISPTEKWNSPTEKSIASTEPPIPYINIYKQNINTDIVSAVAEDKKNSLISEKNKNLNSSENEIQRAFEVSKLPASAKSKKVKNEIFSFSEKLEEMQNDKKRHIQIIALYWKFKGFNYTNENQYKSAISRDLKSSSKLSGYSDEQITTTMKWLEKNAITYVWKLETVHKYIDEKGETPSETSNINSSEDKEAYLMNEGNPQYKTYDIPWNELSENERNKFLENEAIRKKYKDAPFSSKEINFKEFAKDLSVKKTSTLTKEDIKKIPLIDF
jgi:hypothetical protein